MIPSQTRRAALDTLEAWTAGADVAPGARLEVCAPFDGAPDHAALMADLRRALPDLERRDDILLAGVNEPDARWPHWRAPHLVACCGTYLGTFREPLADIPPTGGLVTLPYGEAHLIEDGTIRASYLLWDAVALMRQAGVWPLAAPTGAPGHWPAPKGGGGVRLDPVPEAGSLDRVLDMHTTLIAHKGDVMGLDMSHWAPDFSYWAGGNIGASRGVDGFRAHHQIPYRRAFPEVRGIGHFVRLSDGPFAVTGGDLAVTHSGADFFGSAPTGRTLTFRVMDFYRFDGAGLIAENWLPNDSIGLLRQMGVDVMDRMRHLTGRPRRNL